MLKAQTPLASICCALVVQHAVQQAVGLQQILNIHLDVSTSIHNAQRGTHAMCGDDIAAKLLLSLLMQEF